MDLGYLGRPLAKTSCFSSNVQNRICTQVYEYLLVEQRLDFNQVFRTFNLIDHAYFREKGNLNLKPGSNLKLGCSGNP